MSSSYQRTAVIPFRILVPQAVLQQCPPDVKCYITGECQQLGGWNVEKAPSLRPLKQQQQEQQQQQQQHKLFGKDVQIPLKVVDTRYRFFLAECVNPNDEDSEVTLSIWYWESHTTPRCINLMECMVGKVQPEVQVPVFGHLHNKYRVDRGWLTGQTQVQLHLLPGSFTWFRGGRHNAWRQKQLLASCCSYSIADQPSSDPHCEDSLGPGFESVGKRPALASALKDGECVPKLLPVATDSGQLIEREDYVLFQVDTVDLESTAFHFELRKPEDKSLLGVATLMPLKSSEYKGVKILQVTGNRPGNPLLGTLTVNYLIISSMAPELRNDLSRTYRTHWRKRPTMHVGHRGSGSSNIKQQQLNTVRENTIHSMNFAGEHGADFVELDVQFTKDGVPVVFHDFNVAVTMRLKLAKLRQIEVPVKNFTLESLQSMKLCKLSEMTDNEDSLDTEDADPTERQPFPSLRQCLEQVNSSVGFLIEVKYPQKVKGDELEENVEYYAERNRYTNRILEDVLRYAGDRRVMLCTFDADCCTMLQLKQNRYPVLFLTQGRTQLYPAYEDMRCNSTLCSMYHALAVGVIGLSALVDEFLEDDGLMERVKRCGLVLFLWGDGMNRRETKDRFRLLGADAIIYDGIHTVKERGSLSVFMQEAEDEKLTAAVSTAASPPSSSSAAAAAASTSKRRARRYSQV